MVQGQTPSKQKIRVLRNKQEKQITGKLQYLLPVHRNEKRIPFLPFIGNVHNRQQVLLSKEPILVRGTISRDLYKQPSNSVLKLTKDLLEKITAQLAD